MKLLIAGAGGHGRVAAETAMASGWTSVAFLDDSFPKCKESGSWPIVGRLDDLDSFATAFDHCFAAFGDARLRLRMLARAGELGMQVPALLHPAAVVSPSAVIEPGTLVAAGAILQAYAHTGRGCIINTASSVDHDCRLAPGVHICPGAHLGGNVEVGTRTWFGIGAVALQNICIGADVVVGAGAVCLADIRDGVTVFGVPATERKS